MATFTDKFIQADGDLASVNGWVTQKSDDSITGAIETLANTVTNSDNLQAVAWQATTAPTTAQQEVGGWCAAIDDDDDAWVEVGVGGWRDDNGPTWNLRVEGISARLIWKDDGVRTLEIHCTQNGGEAQSASVDLMLAGGVEAYGYEGRLLGDGDLAQLQHLRLIVTTTDYGLLARAYVNQQDDDKPTLSLPIREDWIEPNAMAEYGHWFFGFGPFTAGDLVLTQFAAADYTLEERAEPSVRSDAPTLGSITQSVKLAYERSQNTNFEDEVYHAEIVNAVEELINTAGDQAWFLRRTETMSLTPDNDGLVTFEPYVRRVLDVQAPNEARRITWQLVYIDEDGQIVARIDRNPYVVPWSVRVTYLLRHTQMRFIDDQCPIPREHLEAVVMGTCLKLAQRDRNAALEKTYSIRYQVAKGLFMRDMNRLQNFARDRFKPRGYRGGYLL